VAARPGPQRRKITVRQLLNHTSGLYNYTDDLPEQRRSYRPQELVAIATGHRPLFAPGTRFSYSNTNYILAGLVVERITGRRLADQLEQRILEPLGLDGTELPATQRRIAGAHARGYAPPDEGWQVTDGPARLVDVTGRDTSWAWAAGSYPQRCCNRRGPPWTPASWAMEPATDSGWRCYGKDAGWSCGATAGRSRAMRRQPSAPLTPTASWSWRSTCSPSQSPGSHDGRGEHPRRELSC
jgi:CubicO group peptidase (beta-lactamase class C family)